MATKVTFAISADIVSGATSGILVGDFNSWSFEEGVSLKKQQDGSFKTSLDLEPGTYQYRYFLNDGRWVNDERSGSFVPEYQVENCVVSVEAAKPKAAAKTKAAQVEAPVIAEAKPKTAKKAKAVKVEAPVAEVAAPVVLEAAPKAKKAAKKK